MDWTLDELDDRLHGLFADDAAEQRATIHELISRAPREPDVEEALVEALESSFEQGEDITSGTAWLIVILGEIALTRAIPILAQGFESDDELIVAASVRALHKIGEPAFEYVLEQLDSDALPEDVVAACLRTLEGIRAYDLPGTRLAIEERLRRILREGGSGRAALLKVESAALSLAHIGCADAIDEVERLHTEVYRRSNAFLQEAIDIMKEHPDGTPCLSESSWEEEFRWVLVGDSDMWSAG